MEKLSIFKKIWLFRDYMTLIKRHKDYITDKKNGLNLRVDKIGRVYTVFTCPDDVKQYGIELAEKYIREYISKVEPIFIETGLTEYIGIREINQMIEFSELDFLIVFGFKGFENSAFYRNIIIYSLLLITIVILSYFFFFN